MIKYIYNKYNINNLIKINYVLKEYKTHKDNFGDIGRIEKKINYLDKVG